MRSRIIRARVRVGIRRHLVKERGEQFPEGRNIDHAWLVLQALDARGRLVALGILAQRHDIPDSCLAGFESIIIQLIRWDDELRCVRINVAVHMLDGLLPAGQDVIQPDGKRHMPDDGQIHARQPCRGWPDTLPAKDGRRP